MKTIEGTYTFANIFTTNNEVHAIEDYALAQIQMICDQEASKNCRIRVMPDVHPGKVGPIGLTQTLGDKIILKTNNQQKNVEIDKIYNKKQLKEQIFS